MNASCTTHIVKNEAEAIQMFIFQNNRGKTPSNLEIIKAQFLYNVHLYGGAEDEKADLLYSLPVDLPCRLPVRLLLHWACHVHRYARVHHPY